MNIIGLIPYGRDNAIPRAELARMVGLSDRKLRVLIREIRSKWTAIEPFICSTSEDKGYWLSNNTEEIRAVRNWYYSYIESSGFVLNNIDRELAKLDGTGLVYVRPHYRRIGGRL